jgi:glucose-6-phosphate dehydrogenase assembly protein OpcA
MTDTRYLCPLGDVERELNQQMKQLQGQGQHLLQRARMSNLVIFCTSLEASIAINEQIPQIAAVHPSRTLLLVGEAEPERDLTARITVRPIDNTSKHHILAEQVTLHAGGANVNRLPFAVRSLLIGDLPINLWWAVPQPPPLAGPLLYELGEHAQQIIYDSLGWPDPVRGVATTGSWLEHIERPGGQWRVASDLNWRRLKYWRRFVMQSLDPVVAGNAAETVSEIVLEHGPHAVVQAWLLAAFLTCRLGWEVLNAKVSPNRELTWRCRHNRGESWVRIRRLEQGAAEIHLLRLACTLDGKPGALNLRVVEQRRLVVQLEGVEAAPRTMAMPPHTAEEVVGRQLSDRERDPVFREAMSRARQMAENVLQRPG